MKHKKTVALSCNLDGSLWAVSTETKNIKNKDCSVVLKHNIPYSIFLCF